jgi:hypothetical protein
LSITLQSVTWIVPTVQSVHILLIAAVMSSLLLIDLRLLGRRRGNTDSVTRYLRTVWIALPGLALSGALLIIAEPARELTNPAFYTKMLLLGCAAATTWGVARHGGRRSSAGFVGRCGAALSLALWVGVVVAGRWIAYAQVQ